MDGSFFLPFGVGAICEVACSALGFDFSSFDSSCLGVGFSAFAG